MRDIGILVWVALLLVGVGGSMLSRIRSLRRLQTQQMQSPQRAQPPPVPTMPWPLQPQPFVSRPAHPLAPAPRPAPQRPPPQRPPVQAPRHVKPDTARAAGATATKAVKRLFGDRSDLIRAVIAAEVLGKPRAFGDEYLRNP
jgi:hypothetical protein